MKIVKIQKNQNKFIENKISYWQSHTVNNSKKKMCLILNFNIFYLTKILKNKKILVRKI